MKVILSLLLFICAAHLAIAQSLQPGFDKQEYRNLMKVSAQFGDSAYRVSVPPPAGYKLIYRSEELGLANKWDLWTTDHSIPVISIRGSTASAVSWLANFYSAMVPAKGRLTLSESSNFDYQLATDPKAAVHVGWLVATAFLVRDMLPKIDSLYKQGKKEMLIIGHSQGGGIAYLLTAYLYNLQKQHQLPADLRFKAYCSAAPKPGNLNFAYEYEAETQGGWAYNVVNSADWVPETLISIQTKNDFNDVNPFGDVGSIIKKQSFFKRIAFRHAWGKLTRSNEKAQRNYQKYLGAYPEKSVRKLLPGFKPPEYVNTYNYVRTGNTIVLLADEAYYKKFPQDKSKLFINHLHQSYLYLLDQLSLNGETIEMKTTINGTWELNFLEGKPVSLDALYPRQKPTLLVNDAANKISGTTGCNNFSGSISVEGAAIKFFGATALTKMACPGEGEQTFLETLGKSNRYVITETALTLLTGDVPLMRFIRK